MPAWIGLITALERACTSRSGSVAENKMALIQACADGMIATRWRGHYSGGSPSISRQQWAGADIDLEFGRVTLADGNSMLGVEVNSSDLEAWLSPQAKAHRRFSSDEGLVQEGVAGLRNRIWPNRHQAAIALAPKAEGQSEKAKIDRLERKIKTALGNVSQNIPKHPE